ncbi:winged helix-turn-helix domain-containing protein [Rugamonas sp. A1-17]|nr:winged helix-turn-helix domain-containing protein [Rugamonas sp. A1-17]
MNHKSFRFGQWRVDPATNTLSCGDLNRQLEPRAMDVLLHLCKYPHVVVSAETLLDACWGDVSPSDNAVHKIITQLRRALDDSAVEPRYIETIRKRGYRLLAELSYDDDVSNGSWLHASPFRGLEAFEEQHAAIFFGRKLGVDQLVQVVLSQVQAACAMVLVLGPSGAGKTSLVQAGLIPALKAGAAPAESGLAIASHVQLDCADMGQSGLLDTLASVLLDAELDGNLLFENTSAVALAQRMAQDLPGLIAYLQARLPTIRLMLFIDRFEAIFRLPHIGEQERAAFIHVLDQLARSGCILIVLACRNDFYPHLSEYPALMGMKLRGGHFDLAPPGAADIAQIIRHPVQVAQLRYTVDAETGESLDQVLIDAAKAGPDTLPLLQYCLQELYRLRSPEGELSHASFHALGGLEGAIGARAEQVISALGSAQIAALPHVLSQLVLVAEDESTVTSRRVPWSALRNEADHGLVQALVDAHLFVSDLHGGAPAFGIAHEALLRRWPRVVAWIEEHRQALQVRSRISAQARRWQDSGRARDMLLPSGTQANQARQLLKTSGFSFTPQEHIFVQASLQGVQRGERLRMTITIVMAGLALLAGGLFLMARSAQQAAEQHRTEAEELMGYMLGDFVDKLRPLGKLDLLDSVSNRALKYLSDPARNNESGTALAQRAKSLQVLSEVKIARADPAGAMTALLAGREILLNQLKARPTDLVLLKSAGENSFWLGQIHLDQKEWGLARQYFEEYRDNANRQAAAAPSDVSSWIEQSYAHNSLGSVALRSGDVRRAASEFALSVDLKTRAYDQTPKDKVLAGDLADSLSWQASAQVKLGKLAEAEALHSRELNLLKALHETYPADNLWLTRIGLALSMRSELRLARGNQGAGKVDLEQALSALQGSMEKDPSNRNLQRNLHLIQLRLLETDAANPKPALVLEQLEKLQQSFSMLSQLEPKKLILQVMLSNVQQRMAITHFQAQEPATAVAILTPTLQKLEQLHSTTPTDQGIRNALVDTLLLSAELNELKDADVTRRLCERVQTMLHPIIKDSADYHVLAPWVRAHACLNQIEYATAARAMLETMGYRDPTYLRYISTHPPKKVKS